MLDRLIAVGCICRMMMSEKPLTELLQETNQDLESVLGNLENFVVTQHTLD